MNYVVHYDRMMERAKSRILGGYQERHHVVPRCMGGGNESRNIVNLTAAEHYVAHQLLAKIYPHIKGLVWAAIRQARGVENSRAHEWLKRRQAVIVGNLRRGKPLSTEHAKRLSTSRIGATNSTEHRAKISASLLGHVHSSETRAKISASRIGQKGATPTPERIKQFVAASIERNYWLGKKHSPETRAKMSESQRIYWDSRR